MNYYQHHIGDYAAATSYLSLIEDAVYTRLLRVYYRDEKPLKNDIVTIARMIGLRSRKEKEALEWVMSQFFTLHDDGWRNARADEEIAVYHGKAETARENGRQGGRPRKESDEKRAQTQTKPSNNPEETQTKPSNNPEETGSKANHKPITNNQEEKKEERNKENIAKVGGVGEGNKTGALAAETGRAGNSNHDAPPLHAPPATHHPAVPQAVPDVSVQTEIPIREAQAKKAKKSRKRENFTLKQALTHDFDTTGIDRFIREDDPVVAWAEKIGLPEPFLLLGWEEFLRRYLHAETRQKDWRAHFRNACRRDWLGIWRSNDQGEFWLTQAGKQLERELDAEREHEQREHRAQSPPGEPEPDAGDDNAPHLIAHLFGDGGNPLSAQKWLD